MFEELGPGFTLLALDAEDGQVQAFTRAAEQTSVPLKVIRDSYAAERTVYEEHMMLVRPDQFVAWAGDALPDDPTPLIAQITGQTSR